MKKKLLQLFKFNIYTKWRIVDTMSTPLAHYCILMRTNLHTGNVKFKKVAMIKHVSTYHKMMSVDYLRQKQMNDMNQLPPKPVLFGTNLKNLGVLCQ